MAASKLSVTTKDDTYTVVLSGRFDFSLHKEFTGYYRDVTRSHTHFVVDMSQIEYMDSSALGMLLQLKEHAEKIKGKVVLHRPTPAVRDVLNIAHFDSLFEIK
jgi:anti-anti-sigma factor